MIDSLYGKAMGLYGPLKGFKCDIDLLKEYFETTVLSVTPQTYFEGNSSYDGWAISSDDGTIERGVRYIEMIEKPFTKPTKLYTGVAVSILNNISKYGLRPHRVRIMRLHDGSFNMRFHRDGEPVKEIYRLHIPIFTNKQSYFEWLVDGRIIRKHFKANGGAWWVRVDILHRAVNLTVANSKRVHLLMDIMKPF